jgi:hypothetical protein
MFKKGRWEETTEGLTTIEQASLEMCGKACIDKQALWIEHDMDAEQDKPRFQQWGGWFFYK